MLNGRPLCATKIPAACQPPNRRPASPDCGPGIFHVALATNRCRTSKLASAQSRSGLYGSSRPRLKLLLLSLKVVLGLSLARESVYRAANPTPVDARFPFAIDSVTP